MTSRKEALEVTPALRAIRPELDAYEQLLIQWQRSINLVSASTLHDLWMRHFADSAQILEAAPLARIWADLGSGAGFPGMITALLLKGRPEAHMHLIESDQRKAAFLRSVSRETGAPATIHATRIEAALPRLAKIEAVSARALAPLPRLLEYAGSTIQRGAIGVFLKGEDWSRELTAIPDADRFAIETLESRTDKRARVVVVKRAT